jgi:hypothetical protein
LDVALAGDALLLGVDDPDDRRGALLRRLVIPQLVLAAACIPFVLGRDVGAAMGSQEWRRTIGANAATRDFLGFWSDQFRGRFVHADELATAWDAFRHAWSWTDVAGRLGRALLRISLAPLAVLVCAAAALPGAWRTPRRAVWLAVLVPLVIEAMISSRESLELTRYAIFVAPPLFVLVALGVARLPRVIGAAALALLLLATELGIREYEQIGSRDTDYRTVAALFAREAHPGDSVVVAPWYLAPTLSYYAPALDFVTGERHRGGWGKAAFPGRGEATAERWMIVDYRAGDFYHASGDSIATSAPFIGAHVRVVLDTIVPTGIRVLRFLPDDAPPSGRE